MSDAYQPYVRRRNISYEEIRQYKFNYSMAEQTPTSIAWTATLDGNLNTGERVRIERIAATRQEAANALAEEIAVQGWSIQ